MYPSLRPPECRGAILAVEAKSAQARWGSLGARRVISGVVFVDGVVRVACVIVVIVEIDAQSDEPCESDQRGNSHGAALGDRELDERVHGSEERASGRCESSARRVPTLVPFFYPSMPESVFASAVRMWPSSSLIEMYASQRKSV